MPNLLQFYNGNTVLVSMVNISDTEWNDIDSNVDRGREWNLERSSGMGLKWYRKMLLLQNI